MVNYILSFCKITAASRLFSRNFYLPLLKPLTPKDALRTFRITGKWLLGSKTQHYIPVLLNHSNKRSQKEKDYGQVVHEVMDGYSYMIPILDKENESHRLLIEILNSKNAEGCFVYKVDDKRCNIILTAPLELAIRDGEVIDVMVSQRNDKILVKMANFKKVGIDMEPYPVEENGPLYHGEGATTKEEERCHHHGKFTMSIAKIFEDKEREAEEWELELQRIINSKRKQKGEGSKEWNEMLKYTIKNLNWNQFEKDAKKVVDQIQEPVVEQHIGMEVEDLELTRKVPQVIMSYGIGILPTMAEIPDVVNCMADAKLHEIEAEIEEEELTLQNGDNEQTNGGDNDEIDPSEEEIIQQLVKKKVMRRVSGVKVILSSGKECFVSGQMVKTDDGDVFVPGQTIESDFGLEYSPGFTVNMDGQPTLIKGLIMGEENQQKPLFLPTESTITSDGQLSFATTKEERVKYKPRPKPLKRKKKTSKKEEQLEQTTNHEEIPVISEEPEQKVVKKKKKKVKKEKSPQEEDEIVLMTPIMEIKLEELLADYLVGGEDYSTSFEEKEHSPTPTREESDDSSSIEAKRRELEQLMMELMDDGMDDLLASIEDKKASLEQKLEQLRKLKMACDNNTITYVSLEHTQEICSAITSDEEISSRISEIILTLVRRIASIRDRRSIHPENISSTNEVTTFSTDMEEKLYKASDRLKIALKSAVVASNEVFKTRPRDQIFGLKAMTHVLIDALQNESTLNELNVLITTPLDRNDLCTALLRELSQPVIKSKVEIIKSLAGDADSFEEIDDPIEKLADILENEGDIFAPAMVKLLKNQGDLLEKILDVIRNKIGRIRTETATIEAVKDAVVAIVLKYADDTVKYIDENYKSEALKDFIEEGCGLAKALGLNDCSDNLSNMALDPDVDLCECDRQSLNILKRLCIIRKLAEKDFSLKTALQRLKQNPERCRSDSRIRLLVKESGILMTQASPLKNSKDLPLHFLKTENNLAVEDFLAQRIKLEAPVLITKKGLQAIIPPESSRAVLAGRIPYILVDESGISNFKPMHMLSALKGRDIHFEDYASKVGERDRSQSPFLSPSRSSSPVTTKTDIKSRARLPFSKSRMVA